MIEVSIITNAIWSAINSIKTKTYGILLRRCFQRGIGFPGTFPCWPHFYFSTVSLDLCAEGTDRISMDAISSPLHTDAFRRCRAFLFVPQWYHKYHFYLEWCRAPLEIQCAETGGMLLGGYRYHRCTLIVSLSNPRTPPIPSSFPRNTFLPFWWLNWPLLCKQFVLKIMRAIVSGRLWKQQQPEIPSIAWL